MGKDPDRETLLDLFSTRAPEHGERPAAGGGRATEHLARRGGPGANDVHRVSLSPIANAVLREARRDLGSQDNDAVTDRKSVV